MLTVRVTDTRKLERRELRIKVINKQMNKQQRRWKTNRKNEYGRKSMEIENQAGYTATSCGRLGRGGNARFPTFQFERDGPTDQPTDGRTD